MDERWVRLKSRVGPTALTIRIAEPTTLQYTLHKVEFSIDNSCTDNVPESWWNEQQEQFLDRSQNLKYKEAFEVLDYGIRPDPMYIR